MQSTDPKTQIRTQQIAEGLMQGKTYKQIAQEIGITREHLHALLREKPEYKTLIIAEITEMETHLIELLKTLEESTSPQDKRTAAVELGKMIRHAKDKTYPTLHQQQNINLNIDTNQLNKNQQTLTRTLNRLPTEHLKLFWKIYNEEQQNNPQKQLNTHNTQNITD